jgi:hypothetical protein
MEVIPRNVFLWKKILSFMISQSVFLVPYRFSCLSSPSFSFLLSGIFHFLVFCHVDPCRCARSQSFESVPAIFDVLSSRLAFFSAPLCKVFLHLTARPGQNYGPGLLRNDFYFEIHPLFRNRDYFRNNR